MGEYADMFINDQIEKACKVGDTPRRTIAEQVADGTLTDGRAGLTSEQVRRSRPWKGVGDPTPRKGHPVEGVVQPWSSDHLPSGLPQLLVGQKAACTICGLDGFTVSMDRGKLRLRDENGFWHGCDPDEKSIDNEIQTVKEIPLPF